MRSCFGAVPRTAQTLCTGSHTEREYPNAAIQCFQSSCRYVHTKGHTGQPEAKLSQHADKKRSSDATGVVPDGMRTERKDRRAAYGPEAVGHWRAHERLPCRAHWHVDHTFSDPDKALASHLVSGIKVPGKEPDV
jgi:hypothetical protein